MTGSTVDFWSPADFCLTIAADPSRQDLPALAAAVYAKVCRTDFRAPGFCLLDLGGGASSASLRRMMVDLKNAMDHVHRTRTGRHLVFVSAGRFDQQATTKFHRDGGPEESLLMLGYEPSPVEAEMSMADYARCAYDLGLTPAEFLDRHNPMFAPGEKLLEPYTTRVSCFSNRRFQILLINNSVAALSAEDPRWQGVLHTARILRPPKSSMRVVNSTMLASVPAGMPEPVSSGDLHEFATTASVSNGENDGIAC